MSRHNTRVSDITGKKVTDYIDNEKLTKAIIDYNIRHVIRQEQGLKQEIMPDIIGLAILKITHGIGSKHNFRNYTYHDEMVDDAIVQAVYSVTKFDMNKFKLSYNEKKKLFVYHDPRSYVREKMTKEQEEAYKKFKKKNPLQITYGSRKIKDLNAFGWLTLVVWRAMTHRIKLEKEQQKIIEDLMSDPNYMFHEADGNNNDIDSHVDISKENATEFYWDGKL